MSLFHRPVGFVDFADERLGRWRFGAPDRRCGTVGVMRRYELEGGQHA